MRAAGFRVLTLKASSQVVGTEAVGQMETLRTKMANNGIENIDG